MKLNPQLNSIRKAINEAKKKAEKGAELNRFVSFLYQKEGETVQTKRLARFGGNIAKRMIKQGTPIKGKDGKGCWIDSAEKSGKNSMILRRGGKVYLRGTEVKGKESQHKCFLLSGITVK